MKQVIYTIIALFGSISPAYSARIDEVNARVVLPTQEVHFSARLSEPFSFEDHLLFFQIVDVGSIFRIDDDTGVLIAATSQNEVDISTFTTSWTGERTYFPQETASLINTGYVSQTTIPLDSLMSFLDDESNFRYEVGFTDLITGHTYIKVGMSHTASEPTSLFSAMLSLLFILVIRNY